MRVKPYGADITPLGIVVFAIFVISLIGMLTSILGDKGDLSIGINGVTETRCIKGYEFVVTANGDVRQILNELGKGVRCK